MNGCTVLEDALAKGGKVVWDPPTKPQLFVPKGMVVLIQQDIATVKEVMRRAVAFRGQAQTPGPIPLLILPGHQGGEGCLSCGTPVERGHFRCEVCTLAVVLALD